MASNVDAEPRLLIRTVFTVCLVLITGSVSPASPFPLSGSCDRVVMDVSVASAMGQNAIDCGPLQSHRRVLAAQGNATASPLEGTYWKAVELGGTAPPTQDPKREAHLLFHPGGHLTGSDGCNQIAGSYELNGDVVKFGEMFGTQMGCITTGDIVGAFHQALRVAARLRVAGDRLELMDASGMRVAVFTARPRV